MVLVERYIYNVILEYLRGMVLHGLQLIFNFITPWDEDDLG